MRQGVAAVIDSRRKGVKGQGEIATILKHYGLDYVEEQSGRIQGADFRIGPYCLEARRRNKLQIVAWSRELEDKTPERFIPVLAYRPDREPWRASLLLHDLLDLIQADLDWTTAEQVAA